MKSFIAAIVCSAAIGVRSVLFAPYAAGDCRRCIFVERHARRRSRTQSGQDELEMGSRMLDRC